MPEQERGVRPFLIANDVPHKTAEREKPAKQHILLNDSNNELVISRPYVGRRSCHRIDSSQGEVWMDSLKSQVSRACTHSAQGETGEYRNLRRKECSLVTWSANAYCVGRPSMERKIHGAKKQETTGKTEKQQRLDTLASTKARST